MTAAAPRVPEPGIGRRTVGVRGAVGIGIGSMLGAGVFVVWGPATSAAGEYLLIAVAVAAIVAACNAYSTASLAARHPVAGGAYAYGALEVNATAGYVAGLGFVIGKTASLAAMGLAIGAYVWPEHSAVVATVTLLLAWGLNVRGVTRTALAATLIGVAVLVALAIFIAAGASQPAAPVVDFPSAVAWWEPLAQVGGGAAIIFFAFAGYARVATLGEEVRNPARTIPLAITIALPVVLVAYLAVAAAVSRRPGLGALPDTDAPIAELVRGSAVPVAAVSVVAVVAAFGAMVALAAGVGRTAMAMARERDLPASLARQSGRGVPWLAEAIAILVAIALAWVGNLGFALAMSSFAVVTYYAVANLAAIRAYASKSITAPRVARWIARLGLTGCVLLALSLPVTAALASIGLGVLALAVRWFAAWLTRTRAALRAVDNDKDASSDS